MIVVNLTNQLGNQMFAYASVKCIAIAKGYEFKYCRTPLQSNDCNDSDRVYGTEIRDIFCGIPACDYIDLDNLPPDLVQYKERSIKERNKSDYKGVVLDEVRDNTVLNGHFATTVFFEDKLHLLRNWFLFPNDIEQKVNERICRFRENEHPDTILLAVHFRVGKDYTRSGFRLQDLYWFQATDHVVNCFADKGINVRPVAVYDRRTKTVDRFIEKYKALEHHGSMVEDMCFISRCDANVVCNSSFSIMSALLNKGTKMVIRPSRYPTESGYYPESIFLPNWIAVGKGRRSIVSFFFYIKKRYIGIPLRKLVE